MEKEPSSRCELCDGEEREGRGGWVGPGGDSKVEEMQIVRTNVLIASLQYRDVTEHGAKIVGKSKKM